MEGALLMTICELINKRLKLSNIHITLQQYRFRFLSGCRGAKALGQGSRVAVSELEEGNTNKGHPIAACF